MGNSKLPPPVQKKMTQKITDFIKSILSLTFSIGLIIGVAFLIWKVGIFALGKTINIFGYIDQLYESGDLPLPLLLSVVTALATVTTAIVTTLIAKNNDLRLQVRAEQKDSKVLIYEELTQFFFKIIFSSKVKNKEVETEQKDQEGEIVEFLVNYTPKIIMWGSDEVLREFYLFRSKSVSAGSDPKKVTEIIIKFEELLFSIRKDLGHKNRNLRKGNILGLFVNDYEKLLSK